MRLAVALVVALLGLVGCGSSDAQLSPSAVAPSKGSHVFVMVMENKERGNVIGSPLSPYLNSLAHRYASTQNFYGVTHPSLPNYLAMTAGTTFGVHSDCTGCQQSGRSIADQLEAAGVSWRAYMGGMPGPCFTGATSGQYAKKHNPFMYYRSVVANRSRCALRVVPESRLDGDLRAGRLPKYSFLAPGLCDDTHDCPADVGDHYLSKRVPAILKALGPRGFLVLTWDEGTSDTGCCGGLAAGGRIATIVAGPDVRRGASLGTPYTHYSTLRTIEDALRMPRLRLAGDRRVKPLSAAFRSGAVPRLR
jgi:hypothetical protein